MNFKLNRDKEGIGIILKSHEGEINEKTLTLQRSGGNPLRKNFSKPQAGRLYKRESQRLNIP